MELNQPSFKNLSESKYGRPGETQYQPIQDLVKPHIESFDYMIREGLLKSVQCMNPVEFSLPNGQRVSLFLRDASIHPPRIATGNNFARKSEIYPAECRERGTTYKGRLQVSLMWKIDGRLYGPEEKMAGEIPVMVKSTACNLSGMGPKQLVANGEEAEEIGGYFIVNGNEKLMRMLIMPRRNFPTAMTRSSWKNRGPAYTEYGVTMRSVKADETSSTIVLHYLNNGTATLSYTYRKEQFFVPVIIILKALVSVTDQYIYKELINGQEENSYYKGCVANMLRLAQEEELSTRRSVLQYMGKRFRVKVQVPDWLTDEEVAEFLLKECVCIHVNNNMDKFNILTYMTRKLFAFTKGQCATESADNPMFQEVLLGGHLYLKVLKEKLESWLLSVKASVERQAKNKGNNFTFDSGVVLKSLIHTLDIGKSMEFLLATGNLVSKSGLGLMQATGLTVVADKLNFYRYLSHFRSVHRGAFFAEMRTTSVRKLLPEAWGFLCPVHTPDGTPCGLLNHLSALCQVVNKHYPATYLAELLLRLGMEPYNAVLPYPSSQCYVVILDGKALGWLHDDLAAEVVEQLRSFKVLGQEKVPASTEICFVPKQEVPSQYPGLFLFTNVARMVRPVTNLAHNVTEMIGSFEQAYLNICITPDEAYPGITTHQELREDAMLSAIACLTPFSDFNQSPRNMYQCQMGKQTMGTPLHAYQHRADNKLYRIQTPQSPLVRPHKHDMYNMDEYPLGTNAVVAVISYTGYDMEDAMILNKSSYERGFGHGSVYKAEFVDLKKVAGERGRVPLVFAAKPGDVRTDGKLDVDGLPPVGTRLKAGDPYYSYLNVQTGEIRVQRFKGQEEAHVDQIKVLGGDMGTDEMQRVCFIFRINRNPVIGDKFSSRHGQKGICSQKWPVENMPFSESGMTPDIIFNPHGFPSRMTIGMMIESMAGKSSAMHGLCHDATPFTFTEDVPAIDYFGKMLTKAGYNYYGTERMYSGVDGREFEADIFMGVVYYQRLRHMVSDKFQVRTTGPIDQLTHQPVQGRKRMGGVRFGEMERDALLAHGTSFLLEDRLFNCSDYSIGHICKSCGSLLAPKIEKPPPATSAFNAENQHIWTCLSCDTSDTVRTVAVPYVFRYLVAELAAMNIKVSLDVRHH